MRKKCSNTYTKIDERTIKGMCPNGRYFFIDAEDFEKISDRYWSVDKEGRVRCSGGKKCLTLSRIVTNAPPGLVVDHINHCPNDNRKSNLRICTSADNSHNVTAFDPYGRRRGVHKRIGYYAATFKYRDLYLYAKFDDYDSAVAQRTAWEEKYFGEFAPWDRYDVEKNQTSRAAICVGITKRKPMFWEPFFEHERKNRT